jgi:hypothetical protein
MSWHGSLFARLTRNIPVPTTTAPNVVTLLSIQKPNKYATELDGKRTIDLLYVYFYLLFHMKYFEEGSTCLIRHSQHTINSGEQSTFVKLTVAQRAKQLVALYGTWRFVVVFARTHHWSLSWVVSRLNPVHSLTSYCHKIHFNLIPSGVFLLYIPIKILCECLIFHMRPIYPTDVILPVFLNLKSKLLYDCRFTASHFVLTPSPSRSRPDFFLCNWTLAAVVLM